MNGNMFARYLKKHLLKAIQTPTHVGDPSKKPISGDKTKPLNSQSVRLEIEQFRVTWLKHLLVLSRTKKC
jgi:hypothetical protein